MVGYHLAKALWMASHSSAHSDHKVLSAIGQSLKLGILGSIESKLCDRNKRLDALPYSTAKGLIRSYHCILSPSASPQLAPIFTRMQEPSIAVKLRTTSL